MQRYTHISELYEQVKLNAQDIKERKLTPQQLKRREEIAQDLSDDDFKDRYGDDWKSVKIATATKMAKDEDYKHLSKRQQQALARATAKPKSKVSLPKMPDFITCGTIRRKN